jgi:Ca-activated chloride channel family protein
MSFGVNHGPYVVTGLVFVLALAWAFDEWRRRRVLARLGTEFSAKDSGLSRMTASLVPWRRHLGRTLWLLGAALCTLAAMRPRVRTPGTWEQRGIDMVLLMDYSNSMLAADVYPDRLQRMTRAVEEVLDRSIDHRVGVVVFAGAAAHFPLTHDREAVRSMYRGLSVQDLPPGSNLAEAVRVGRCLARAGLTDDPDCHAVGGRGRGGEPIPSMDAIADLSELDLRHEPARDERARALIIFTDGEETEGDAQRELARAVALGVEVFVVAVGTVRGAPVPELDPNGHYIGWMQTVDGHAVQSQLDMQKLARLAEIAGGSERLFFLGSDGAPMSQLARALDRLQRGEVRGTTVIRYREIYEWFLFPGFLLLVIESCLSVRRHRVSYNYRPVEDDVIR